MGRVRPVENKKSALLGVCRRLLNIINSDNIFLKIDPDLGKKKCCLMKVFAQILKK